MTTEKRLIDVSKFPLLPNKLEGDLSEYERGYLDAQQNMILLPTVDVAEVVYGEWSTIEDDYVGMTALQCSECNQEYWFENEPPMKIYNYCPNCGADMRGRNSDGICEKS